MSGGTQALLLGIVYAGAAKATFWLDYQSSTNKLTALRCDNQTSQAVRGTIIHPATKQELTRLFAPGGTTLAVPNNFFTLQFDADGEATNLPDYRIG